jgi:hypothetical protein
VEWVEPIFAVKVANQFFSRTVEIVGAELAAIQTIKS